jgi:amidase
VNDDLALLDATAQAELVRRGEASPAELVEAAIERIERLDPQINAVIHRRFEEARNEAARELPDGPFTGVPFLIKDLGQGLAGDPLHMGMRLLKELDFRCPVDTTLALRFRAAGLVTLGRTNTPELGILPTTEPRAYGPTRNPWDRSRSSGGSSGGAAAAVATGMVPFAHASDGGGSIRIPASACGLVGLKPTRARITEGPLVGDSMSGLSVHFAVTRSVRDAAALLDAVQGPAPGDPYVAPPPPRPYVEELSADPGSLRIAVRTEPLVAVEIEPAVVEAARDAARLLEELGHSVEEAVPLAVNGEGLRQSFLTRWMAGQAATLAQLEGALGRKIGPGEVERLTWALAEEGNRRSSGEYLVAVAGHQLLSRTVAAAFESGVDLILTPTLGEQPPPLGTFDDSGPDPLEPIHRAALTAAFTGLFNVTGNPAISLPLHWSDDGLPIGVQLAGAFGREDLLLRVAAQLEEARPWRDRIPPLLAAA